MFKRAGIESAQAVVVTPPPRPKPTVKEIIAYSMAASPLFAKVCAMDDEAKRLRARDDFEGAERLRREANAIMNSPEAKAEHEAARLAAEETGEDLPTALALVQERRLLLSESTG